MKLKALAYRGLVVSLLYILSILLLGRLRIYTFDAHLGAVTPTFSPYIFLANIFLLVTYALICDFNEYSPKGVFSASMLLFSILPSLFATSFDSVSPEHQLLFSSLQIACYSTIYTLQHKKIRLPHILLTRIRINSDNLSIARKIVTPISPILLLISLIFFATYVGANIVDSYDLRVSYRQHQGTVFAYIVTFATNTFVPFLGALLGSSATIPATLSLSILTLSSVCVFFLTGAKFQFFSAFVIFTTVKIWENHNVKQNLIIPLFLSLFCSIYFISLFYDPSDRSNWGSFHFQFNYYILHRLLSAPSFLQGASIASLLNIYKAPSDFLIGASQSIASAGLPQYLTTMIPELSPEANPNTLFLYTLLAEGNAATFLFNLLVVTLALNLLQHIFASPTPFLIQSGFPQRLSLHLRKPVLKQSIILGATLLFAFTLIESTPKTVMFSSGFLLILLFCLFQTQVRPKNNIYR